MLCSFLLGFPFLAYNLWKTNIQVRASLALCFNSFLVFCQSNFLAGHKLNVRIPWSFGNPWHGRKIQLFSNHILPYLHLIKNRSDIVKKLSYALEDFKLLNWDVTSISILPKKKKKICGTILMTNNREEKNEYFFAVGGAIWRKTSTAEVFWT